MSRVNANFEKTPIPGKIQGQAKPIGARVETNQLDQLIRLNRELGSVEARLSGLERSVDQRLDAQRRELVDLKLAHQKSCEKLDKLISLAEAGRASWKTILFIGGTASGGTLLILKIIEALPK